MRGARTRRALPRRADTRRQCLFRGRAGFVATGRAAVLSPRPTPPRVTDGRRVGLHHVTLENTTTSSSRRELSSLSSFFLRSECGWFALTTSRVEWRAARPVSVSASSRPATRDPSTRHDPARPGTTRHDPDQPGTTKHDGRRAIGARGGEVLRARRLVDGRARHARPRGRRRRSDVAARVRGRRSRATGSIDRSIDSSTGDTVTTRTTPPRASLRDEFRRS